METCGYKPPVACEYCKLVEQNQAVKFVNHIPWLVLVSNPK